MNIIDIIYIPIQQIHECYDCTHNITIINNKKEINNNDVENSKKCEKYNTLDNMSIPLYNYNPKKIKYVNPTEIVITDTNIIMMLKHPKTNKDIKINLKSENGFTRKYLIDKFFVEYKKLCKNVYEKNFQEVFDEYYIEYIEYNKNTKCLYFW